MSSEFDLPVMAPVTEGYGGDGPTPAGPRAPQAEAPAVSGISDIIAEFAQPVGRDQSSGPVHAASGHVWQALAGVQEEAQSHPPVLPQLYMRTAYTPPPVIEFDRPETGSRANGPEPLIGHSAPKLSESLGIRKKTDNGVQENPVAKPMAHKRIRLSV